MIQKFGKSSSEILKLKKSFFTENQHHFEKNRKIDALYITQNKRLNCKTCAPIDGIDFVSREILCFLPEVRSSQWYI